MQNTEHTADIAVLDAAGLDIFPGFVDAHTHIGLDGYGIGYEGCDYNEMNDIWTPQLRAIDGINPRDPSFAHAREAGITCVCTSAASDVYKRQMRFYPHVHRCVPARGAGFRQGLRCPQGCRQRRCDQNARL